LFFHLPAAGFSGRAGNDAPQSGKRRKAGKNLGGGVSFSASRGVGGPVGAVTGPLGRGAAIGAVAGGTSGLIHGSTKGAQSRPGYKNFGDRGLREKGYEPIGWK